MFRQMFRQLFRHFVECGSKGFSLRDLHLGQYGYNAEKCEIYLWDLEDYATHSAEEIGKFPLSWFDEN